MEGQRAGRIEQQTGKEKHFMSFWENFKDKVRPGYSIFEDFNPDGAK